MREKLRRAALRTAVWAVRHPDVVIEAFNGLTLGVLRPALGTYVSMRRGVVPEMNPPTFRSFPLRILTGCLSVVLFDQIGGHGAGDLAKNIWVGATIAEAGLWASHMIQNRKK